MDDHMIKRIQRDIDLCFYLMKLDEENSINIKDSKEYKAAKILIATHNKLVKIYYLEEYQKQFLKKGIEAEYKKL